MNLDESLRYLDGHINLEARAGSIQGLSLDHMRALVGVLGDPQDAYPVIHLTGTNGKGSTARMITALLVEAGLSVGTYSSPHLQRVNERISWNGRPIGDEQFAAMVTDLARVAPLSGVTPSYFELLTAGAFQFFAEQAVDVAVIEVGLLGRYDATNVCDADVAVITNIGRDHTDGVGDWQLAIATEKAGIITPESFLVLGETDERLRPVFAAEGPRETWARGSDFSVHDDRPALGGHVVDIRTPVAEHREVFVPLHGAHQAANASCAVAAVEAFFGSPLHEDVLHSAMAAVSVPGRFEVMCHSPLVVIDGAHNPEGAVSAARTLEDEFDIVGRRVLVVGMLGGRDPVQMLELLGARSCDLLIVCTPDSPRAIPASELAVIGRAMGVLTEQIEDVRAAVERALAVTTEEDCVLVTGSLYVVGSARTILESLRT